jgi:hypothetical protein
LLNAAEIIDQYEHTAPYERLLIIRRIGKARS